ncbi:uncharacterized protein LOC133828913 [Humulus lupulus]|uniref:uncharacterized protein LOC133828913 n=1 Tax=Humulus lupulus TaxID=3486 RepID=UPI002B4075BD|nr:uncharacterized protein LOC133828913 [Humulus lupulus]
MENCNLLSWNVRGINKKNKQIVRFCITGQDFCLTVVYGSNQLETRKELWFELANLPFPVKPWIIVGDFNAVFDPNDRKGGRSVTKKEIVDARNWLDLGLVEELQIMGSFYTWSNNQDGDNRIYSKLGRVFINEGWLDAFPTVTTTTHWEVTSDHCVILLKQTGILNEGITPFRFYNMWTAHPQFRGTVLTNWNKALRIEGHGLDQISRKLLRLKHKLKKFNWRIIGDVARKYEDTKADYQKTKINLFNDPQNQSLCSAERTSFLRFKRRDNLWKKANRIASYVTADGRVEDNYPKVVSHFVDHFKVVLGCPNKATGCIDLAITYMGPSLSFEDQVKLIKPFSSHEVKEALFSISSIKSPSSDSFGTGFFKSLWKYIGKEVSKAIIEFFDTSHIPKSQNNAILTLIPKVDQPTTAAEYRPIACCTTIYKCISKMLYHRLVGILPKLINQNQGGFIKDRSLAHNVLILQDLIKGYKRKHSSPRCLMKIDLSKAYDSIDLNFLENLLKALRFPGCFIRWVMICMRGSSYCLMMNGRLQGSFQGGKGLRQGDPISPLLFVIVMEYLTRSLFQATKEKGFKFHPLCKSLNIISLCFVDDLLIVCKANTSSIQIIQHTLDDFSSTSGLLINKNKSRIYFGGVSVSDKSDLLKLTQLAEGEFPLIYLGRFQLIQTVLLSIRNYSMSIFLLPQSIIKEIDHLCRMFLWGGKGTRSKFHLTSWEQGTEIWDYIFHQDSSWYWKKLIKISKSLSISLLDSVTVQGKLKLNRLYYLLLPGNPNPSMKSVWYNISMPKHRFILWQVVHQKLPTSDLLHHCHMSLPSLVCPICELEDETHSHVFFECVFSKRVVQLVFEWLHGLYWPSHFIDCCKWLSADRKSFRDWIIVAALAASIYHIWYTRNSCYFDSSCFTVCSIVNMIKTSVIGRILGLKLRSKNLSSKAKLMIEFIVSL